VPDARNDRDFVKLADDTLDRDGMGDISGRDVHDIDAATRRDVSLSQCRVERQTRERAVLARFERPTSAYLLSIKARPRK